MVHFLRAKNEVKGVGILKPKTNKRREYENYPHHIYYSSSYRWPELGTDRYF
jgi:hypothetical protein